MSENSILVNKYYVKGNLSVKSPLILGSGEESISDKDLIRDWDNNIFISGTALAGACRHYLDMLLKPEIDEDNGQTIESENEIIREVFGEIEKESTQSLIIFYDCDDLKKVDTTVRDGVDINHLTRVAKKKAKFNYEILEPGASCTFKLEISVRGIKRQENNIGKIEHLLFLLLDGFKKGKIQLGAKNTRGFGVVQLENCKILKLSLDNTQDRKIWVQFKWNDWDNWELLKDFSGLIDQEKLSQISLTNDILESKDFKIDVDFAIPYSLLIRSSNPNPLEEDVVHLSSNGNPIIPGTSWAGALRNAIFQLSFALDKVNEFEILVDDLFGFVKSIENEPIYEKRAKKSKIYVKESIINQSKLLDYTRNRIDRFTGGTVETALFTEKPSYLGHVKLNINIKNYQNYHIGLVLLAIKELWNGLQPIGGGANVGRGILNGTNLTINGKERDINSADFEQYYSAILENIS